MEADVGELSDYSGFLQYDNGGLTEFGETDYHTDYWRMSSPLAFIARRQRPTGEPFFLWASPTARRTAPAGADSEADCAAPPIPAARHGSRRHPALPS